METEKVRTHGVISRVTPQNPINVLFSLLNCCIFATLSHNRHFLGLFSCNSSGFLIGLVYKMRKTHKNNNSINCDTLYYIQTSNSMIVYTDNMKKTIKINKKVKEVLMTKIDSLESNLQNRDMMNQLESAEENILRIDIEDTISKCLLKLNERQERVLRMRFGIKLKRDYTLEEVADFFNLGRERIRQIEAKALRILRHPANSKFTKTLLEVA